MAVQRAAVLPGQQQRVAGWDVGGAVAVDEAHELGVQGQVALCAHHVRWSHRRRRHQARARHCTTSDDASEFTSCRCPTRRTHDTNSKFAPWWNKDSISGLFASDVHTDLTGGSEVAVAAWLLIIVGAFLACLGGFALFKLKQSEATEVEWVGIKVKTPVPGIAVIAIGLGAIVFGTTELPKPMFDVVDVTLATDNNQPAVDYGDVLCPMSVGLTGHISVSGGHGTVSYRFDRAEGLNGPTDQGPVKMVSFTSAGTATIHDSESVTIPKGTVYFKEYLTIINPGNRQSNPVAVTVSCDPTARPAPPIPPPSVTPPPP
jgi:hypothetical protein